MTKILSKECILDVNDLPFEEVEIPEWGGSVVIGTMSGKDREAWEVVVFGADGKTKSSESMRATLAAFTILDENGERMFTEAEVSLLAKKSSSSLERIFKVAQRLNGLSPSAVDTALGNSGDAPAESSTSD